MRAAEYNKKRILDFLHDHVLATISTIDKTNLKPESALIAFAELDNLELLFETFHDTRKYNNLAHNKGVALVIGWDTRQHITLQYEGLAEQIADTDVVRYREIFLRKKTPCDEAFLLDPRVRLFHVKPTWMALSDCTGASPKVLELTF